MLTATSFILSWTVIQPVFSLYALEIGADLVQVGVIYSLMSFFPLILRIPMSVLAERIGRNRMLVAGMVITITASIFYSNAKSYVQILIITLYNSLATGSFNQVAMSTVSDLAPPDQQGDALGRYLTFLGLGMLIGPAMCSILVDFMSYEQLFLLSALFPAIGLGLLLLYPPKAPKRSVEESRDQEISTLESLKKIFRNRNVMLLS
jgi:MFS family permease